MFNFVLVSRKGNKHNPNISFSNQPKTLTYESNSTTLYNAGSYRTVLRNGKRRICSEPHDHRPGRRSDSSPVIGASIFVTDGQHKTSPLAGTTTDVNGKYSLSIPANAAEITAQFIGYESQTQKIGGGRTAF